MTLIAALLMTFGLLALHIASAVSAGRAPNALDWIGGLLLVGAFWIATPLLQTLP